MTQLSTIQTIILNDLLIFLGKKKLFLFQKGCEVEPVAKIPQSDDDFEQHLTPPCFFSPVALLYALIAISWDVLLISVASPH